MARRAPWVLLIVGLLIAVVGATFAISGIISTAKAGAHWTTPSSETVELTAGDWTVFEQVSSLDRARSNEHLVSWKSVTVTGPQGPVPITCQSCGMSSQTLTLNNTNYLGVAEFTASVDGIYTVDVAAPGATVMVAPPVGPAIMRFLGWVSIAVLGFMIAGAAVLWLLIRLFTGKQPPAAVPLASAAAPATGFGAASPPVGPRPGWYTDPGDATSKRWWDGANWTDQTLPPS